MATERCRTLEISCASLYFPEPLREKFDRDYPFGALHRMIAAVPAALLIVTSNYDSLQLTGPDLVPVVRLAHIAKLRHIFGQRIALPWRHLVIIEHVLDRRNRVIELPLIEPVAMPLYCKITQLLLGVIQAVPISPREVPGAVAWSRST